MESIHALLVAVGLLLLGDSAVGIQSSAFPVQYSTKALQGDEESCPTADKLDATRDAITTSIETLLQSKVVPVLQPCSCGGPEWTRIAYLNMTDPSQNCPSNWNLITSPKRSCGRSSGSASCVSATFGTGALQYNQVCGQVTAYQVGWPDAFGHGSNNLDSHYVDGVSVTHGNPRQHIWTFATAPDEIQTTLLTCPCTNVNNPNAIDIPSFVGNDYFCETGVPHGSYVTSYQFNYRDALWDGNNCGPTSTCCAFNNPPWFCKKLSQPTTDDLEVRICGSESTSDENTPIELLEIYVK